MTFLHATAGSLEQGATAFPATPPRTGLDGTLRYDDLVYACEPGYRPLFLDLRLPATPATGRYPLIVWIHGGGWTFGSRKRQAPNIDTHHVISRLGAAGYAVALVDYRLAREAPFPAQILDLRGAIRWLRGHADLLGIDPTRVAVWGESAGAHLALMTAWCDRETAAVVGEHPDESEQVEAVVEWYGPADLSGMRLDPDTPDVSGETAGPSGDNPLRIILDGSDWTVADLSPMSYVRAGLPPTMIAHGVDDRLVPVDQSRLLRKALADAGSPVEYLEVAGDHVFVGGGSIDFVVERGLAFLDTVLATPEATASTSPGAATPHRHVPPRATTVPSTAPTVVPFGTHAPAPADAVLARPVIGEEGPAHEDDVRAAIQSLVGAADRIVLTASGAWSGPVLHAATKTDGVAAIVLRSPTGVTDARLDLPVIVDAGPADETRRSAAAFTDAARRAGTRVLLHRGCSGARRCTPYRLRANAGNAPRVPSR